jgi:hypothetical protein
MSNQPEDRIPVIVGVGEFSDHPKELTQGLEPLALMEQALLSGRLLVGKCVVVQGEEDAMCVDAMAQAIRHQDVLTDPLQLRPLPLAGIPGWHAPQDAGFYRQAAYFRPLRDGRVYPLPVEPQVEPTSVGCFSRGAKAAD